MLFSGGCIGRLGKDPELRTGNSGKFFLTGSIACDGFGSKESVWYNFAAFGKTAEIISEHCKKGDKVYLGGRIEIKKWTTKDGAPRTDAEICVDRVELLSSKPRPAEADPF